MENYLEIKNLKVNYKTYEGIRNILDIDELKIRKGETYGIIGESGAGKTVLALTIQRLLQSPPAQIESGEILVGGENVLDMSYKKARELRGKKVAMIFQDPMSALNPVFKIGFQMKKVVQTHQDINDKKANELILKMLEDVKLPDPQEIADKYPHELSGGQRQRIIICMALLCGAELLIADEPTRNLDVTIQAGILKLLKDLQQKYHVTMLFIGNNLSLAPIMCDHIGILKDGKIIESGTPNEIINNPKHEYTKLLIKSVTAGVGSRNKTAEDAPNLLDVENLKKHFLVKKQFGRKEKGYIKAVDGISFKLKQTETLGIVGESGCGKSTLVNTILMLHPPTAGTVRMNEKEVFQLKKNDLRKERKNVQIVFQDPFWSLNPRWLVKDIIGEPLNVHKNLSQDEYLEEVEKLIEMVGLPKEGIFRYPHEFSGGQRQRLAIARAFSVNPKLIVLDEPTSAIDVISQSQILNILNDMKDKMQLTYIIISHDLSVVNYMADNIMIMYLGKIVEYGESYKVFQNPKHPYTVALFNAIPTLNMKSVDDLTIVHGEIPSAINPPSGCRFHPRCDKCMEVCKTTEPAVSEIDGVQIACHLFS